MYAVIENGGRQYRVVEGQKLKLEKISAEVGDTVNFKVLMLADGQAIRIGQSKLEGSKVVASITQQGRHKKIHIMKFRRRKHHQKQMGHRQYFTEVKIEKIEA